MNQVTSTQELNNLLSEGKITQSEYDELLAAMSNRNNTDQTPINAAPDHPSRVSGLAIASFVFSIMTFAWGPFVGIPGIICGHIARRQIKKNTNLRGSGLAVAGLVIGYPINLYLIAIFSLVVFTPVNPERRHPIDRGFEAVEFKRFAVDSMEGVKSEYWLEFDRNVSHDGGGSFKISMRKGSSSEIMLYETGPLDVDSTKLIYQIHVLKPDDTDYWDTVIPLMRISLLGSKEIKSGSSEFIGYGSSDKKWNIFETIVELPEGAQIKNIKLNAIVIRPPNDVAESVWIDDIRLLGGVE